MVGGLALPYIVAMIVIITIIIITIAAFIMHHISSVKDPIPRRRTKNKT